MKLSLRIPLTLTIIVVVTGVIAFIRIGVKAEIFPAAYFVVWLTASLLLAGITLWSWRRTKRAGTHR